MIKGAVAERDLQQPLSQGFWCAAHTGGTPGRAVLPGDAQVGANVQVNDVLGIVELEVVLLALLAAQGWYCPDGVGRR